MLPIEFRFGNIFENNFLDTSTSYLNHYYDDTGDSYELKLEVPGVKKDDVKISVQKNAIKISTTKKLKQGEDKRTKSFSIPQNIDLDRAEALVEDGILTLRLPKGQIASPKMIPIR